MLTAQLSERFQVSPTPLREALHRFAGEGLVEFIPQRGARVAELSVADSSELIELRSLLEPACVRRSIAGATDAWRSEVSVAVAEVTARLGARRHVVAASENSYRGFYTTLTSTCDSTRLLRYASSVRDQHARYRAATLGSIDRRALTAHLAELADAALAGDHDRATAAVCVELGLFGVAYEESDAR